MCAALWQTRVCAKCSRPELTSAAASEFVAVELRARRSTDKSQGAHQPAALRKTYYN